MALLQSSSLPWSQRHPGRAVPLRLLRLQCGSRSRIFACACRNLNPRLSHGASTDSARDRDEITRAVEDLRFGDEIEVGPRAGHIGTLGEVGHPEKPTGIRPELQTFFRCLRSVVQWW